MSRSILLLLLVTSCIGKDKPYAQKLTVHPESSHIMGIEADTLKIDVAKSKINWTAPEMWGARRRTGKISFKDGFFLINDNEIVGGDFIVDMETMDVTDVPIHEKKARIFLKSIHIHCQL